MKKQLLLGLLILCSTLVYGQKLGFSSFSSLGGTHNGDRETFHYNIGEPIIDRYDGTNFTMRQGMLNTDFVPAPDLSTIQVRFFLDENEDGRKNFDEKFLEGGRFSLENEVYNIFRSEGIIFTAPDGEYTFEYQSYDPRFLLTTDNTVTITTDQSLTNYYPVYFGVAPDFECVDPDIKMASGKFKCFEEVDYRVCVMNRGCVPYTDTVYVEIDNRINPDSIFYRETPDIIVDDHTAGWVVTVVPGTIIVLHYTIVAPEVTMPEDLGVIYKTRAWVDINDEIGTEEELAQPLKCSYDPNDKLVQPDREDNLALLEDDLVYTIRFQNTGNDYADDVLVIDTLSEHLDITTFKLIYTSHPRSLQIAMPDSDENIIHFRFDNISLPDSTTNEPGSNGQVMFSISPREGTALEDVIENTGYIYFDRNPAIITNTVKSIMVDEFPIVGTKDIEHLSDINIYPNPTSGIVNLTKTAKSVKVYDLSGRLLLKREKVEKINCTQLASGTYLMEIRENDKTAVQKLFTISQK